jgi:hypothetical protein
MSYKAVAAAVIAAVASTTVLAATKDIRDHFTNLTIDQVYLSQFDFRSLLSESIDGLRREARSAKGFPCKVENVPLTCFNSKELWHLTRGEDRQTVALSVPRPLTPDFDAWSRFRALVEASSIPEGKEAVAAWEKALWKVDDRCSEECSIVVKVGTPGGEYSSALLRCTVDIIKIRTPSLPDDCLTIVAYGTNRRTYIAAVVSRDPPAIGGPAGLDLLCTLRTTTSREAAMSTLRNILRAAPFGAEIIEKRRPAGGEMFYAYREFGPSTVMSRGYERLTFKVEYLGGDGGEKTVSVEVRAAFTTQNRRDTLKVADDGNGAIDQYRGAITRRLTDLQLFDCFEE